MFDQAPWISMVDVARWRGVHQPDEVAYTWLADADESGGQLTYGDVDRRARAIAAWLQAEGLQGQPVLLLYPPTLDFVPAFWGCLYANAVAVPAHPPRANRPDPRLQAIVANAGARAVFTVNALLPAVERWLVQAPGGAGLRPWTTDATSDVSERWTDPRASSATLAMLQYTSGSVSAPKGVMIGHGNMLHNSAYLERTMRLGSASVVLSWLPLFHDMGLFGGVVQPMYMGCPCYLMSPLTFLQRPLRWLQAITRWRATHSGGPNFGYDLCVRTTKPADRAGLDLECWENAWNGAEPIRAGTLKSFAEAFAPVGFRSTTFYPCYGMAETTLQVSSSGRDHVPKVLAVRADHLDRHRVQPCAADDPLSTALVSSGRVSGAMQAVIMQPAQRTRCAAGEVGEVWVSGPSVGQGYWNRVEETKATFGAFLGDTGDGPYLRTGDLGFLHDGELFITGRLKDLIIARGRNHYPQDIEQTVEGCHEALTPNGGAAFGVESDGQEQIVVVQEVRRSQRVGLDTAQVIGAIRRAVAHKHELALGGVLLLRPQSIPKTSSGKIQRQACKAAYLSGALAVVGRWQAAAVAAADPPDLAWPQPATPAEVTRFLRALVAQRLDIQTDEINPRQPLNEVGVDSLLAVDLSALLSARLKMDLPATLLFSYPTIDALAGYLARAVGAQGVAGVNGRPVSGATTSPKRDPGDGAGAIAILGIGCRFPGGADNPERFWQLLHDGVDAVRPVPADRWDADAYYDPRPEVPGKMATRWGGFLDDVDHFDAPFFGITPREAAGMDPQQRLLLQVGWEALEHAGIDPGSLNESPTGVFVGICNNDHLRSMTADTIDAYTSTGNALSVAAGRLSYWLGSQGPSLAIDTACSSSLVAVHLACRSLRQGECRLALAGGVNLILSPLTSIALSKLGMMAADGRCKTFDARADGFVRGEGCGLVVLKRLADARADGDPVLAVIRGSAINQDGRSSGLTAPNGTAQERLLQLALADAAVPPSRVGYVEAHGTGTALGDPIEVHALQSVLGRGRNGSPLAVGSVKTNLGHLEAAAGIAGLIKVVLALQHGEIPPHLHLQQRNPHLGAGAHELVIPTGPLVWEATDGRRIAGVSSFGFSGTNAHVLVEQGDVAAAPGPAQPTRIAGRLHALAAELWAEHGLDRYPGLLAALEALCAGYVLRAFARLGWRWLPGERIALDCLMHRLRLGSRHRSLVQRMLEILEEEEILQARGPQWEVARAPALTDAGAAVEALMSDYLTFATEIGLLARCGEQLAEVLRGTCEPLHLLFPAAALHSAPELYRATPVARIFNTLVQKAISAAFREFPRHRRIRILEIGAGTGGTTEAILPYLDGARTEYVFTDISASFLAGARARFASRPFVTYRMLDIEGDPLAQGFDAHRFDVIVAANVLHTTRSLCDTLEHVKRLLAGRGLVVLLEVTRPQRWLDLTFGLLDGWWRFADHELRPSHPLLSASQWCDLFGSLQFPDAAAVAPEPGDAANHQSLILAQGPPVRRAADSRLPPAGRAPASAGPLTPNPSPPRGEESQEPLTRSSAPPSAGERAQEELPLALAQGSQAQRRAALAAYLCERVGAVMGAEARCSIDPQARFSELGLDSLMAVELHHRIQTDLGPHRTLPTTLIFDHPSIDLLAGFLSAPAADRSAAPLDLRSEAVLDPAIQRGRPNAPPAVEPAAVLLTGATGFLGGFLLRELLQQTRAQVHCLVRAADATAARARLSSQLDASGAWDRRLLARVIPVVGDLGRPRLGLADSTYQSLADTIEVIYHNGAVVDFTRSYASLKPANVDGTAEVLRLAGHATTKPVHYISSSAVFFSPHYLERADVTEEERPACCDDLPNGYAQSKWVAEQLVWQAGDRGIPVVVYRPGLITGPGDTGYCKPDDLFPRLVKGCIQLAAAPEVRQSAIDMIPVDHLSGAVVHLARHVSFPAHAFHFVNPQPIPWDMVVDRIRELGHPIEVLPYEDWLERIRRHLADNALRPMMGLLEWIGHRTQGWPFHPPALSCNKTRAALAKANRTLPSAQTLLQSCFAYLQRIGLLCECSRHA
jgi:thioester reductase-like protein